MTGLSIDVSMMLNAKRNQLLEEGLKLYDEYKHDSNVKEELSGLLDTELAELKHQAETLQEEKEVILQIISKKRESGAPIKRYQNMQRGITHRLNNVQSQIAQYEAEIAKAEMERQNLEENFFMMSIRNQLEMERAAETADFMAAIFD